MSITVEDVKKAYSDGHAAGSGQADPLSNPYTSATRQTWQQATAPESPSKLLLAREWRRGYGDGLTESEQS